MKSKAGETSIGANKVTLGLEEVHYQMSIDINNYLRSGGSIDRQTLNKILESLQAANPDVEDDALQEKIAFAPEMHNKTTTDNSGGADALASETRDRDDFAFTLTPGAKTS